MHWLQTAAKISNEYALAAYGIAALVSIVGLLKGQDLRKRPVLLGLIILAVLLTASLPTVGRIELARIADQPYRISVAVSDQDGNRVSHPSVYTDVPSQIYEIGNAEQVEIDKAHVPASRDVTIFADDSSGTLHGHVKIHLANDMKPSMGLVLTPKPVEVRGNVLDSDQDGIQGVRVSVEGYPDTAVSDQTGFFDLPARFPAGSTVYLLAQKKGYLPSKQQHIVGRIANITLQRAPR